MRLCYLFLTLPILLGTTAASAKCDFHLFRDNKSVASTPMIDMGFSLKNNFSYSYAPLANHFVRRAEISGFVLTVHTYRMESSKAATSWMVSADITRQGREVSRLASGDRASWSFQDKGASYEKVLAKKLHGFGSGQDAASEEVRVICSN